MITRCLAALTVTAATALPACAQTRDRGAGADSALAALDSATVARSLAGRDSWRTDFSRIRVPPGEIVSGGPPKDGIPAIDRPRFESAADADRWLEARDPLIVLEVEGEVRGYPLRILTRHEIVNDVVGGRPYAVTYCPLCNTALVFSASLEGRRLDFGTTGRLRQSDLVMYDRQTETWWQQATGEGLIGALAGARLELVPAPTLSWERARGLYAGIEVLSRETGFGLRYGSNPYVGYDGRRAPYEGFFSADLDERFPALTRVASVDLEGGWAAPFPTLAARGVANGVLGPHAFVVFWQPGLASAVDAARIPEGRDVGQTAAYDRRVDGRALTFERVDDGYGDLETGSRWDFGGRAVSGSLAGRRLSALPHGNPFWFAWAAFRPDTRIWTDDSIGSGSPPGPRAGARRPAAPPPLPAGVTNNAVVGLETGGRWSLFSLLGLDSTRVWSGVTTVSYRWDEGDAAWRTIAPPPGPGRLAATAQAVDGRIFLFGGYTVAEDGTERSVPVVDIYDPEERRWTTGAPMPIPVDDAVSGVWRDSLIVLVSGWHDRDNVDAVQLYDPAADRWSQATPIPGPPVFGHAGGVSGDRIVYLGGVRVDTSPSRFSIERSAWTGRIEPADPTRIEWSELPPPPSPPLYRAAAIGLPGAVVFAGGSANPYNYDGIGYDGGPSEPEAGVFLFDTAGQRWVQGEPLETATMDHRGLVRLRERLLTVGGMIAGQLVSGGVREVRVPR